MEAGKKWPASGLLGNKSMPKTFVSCHGAANSDQKILFSWSFLVSQTLCLQVQLKTFGRNYVIAHGAKTENIANSDLIWANVSVEQIQEFKQN